MPKLLFKSTAISPHVSEVAWWHINQLFISVLVEWNRRTTTNHCDAITIFAAAVFQDNQNALDTDAYVQIYWGNL